MSRGLMGSDGDGCRLPSNHPDPVDWVDPQTGAPIRVAVTLDDDGNPIKTLAPGVVDPPRLTPEERVMRQAQLRQAPEPGSFEAVFGRPERTDLEIPEEIGPSPLPQEPTGYWATQTRDVEDLTGAERGTTGQFGGGPTGQEMAIRRLRKKKAREMGLDENDSANWPELTPDEEQRALRNWQRKERQRLSRKDAKRLEYEAAKRQTDRAILGRERAEVEAWLTGRVDRPWNPDWEQTLFQDERTLLLTEPLLPDEQGLIRTLVDDDMTEWLEGGRAQWREAKAAGVDRQTLRQIEDRYGRDAQDLFRRRSLILAERAVRLGRLNELVIESAGPVRGLTDTGRVTVRYVEPVSRKDRYIRSRKDARFAGPPRRVERVGTDGQTIVEYVDGPPESMDQYLKRLVRTPHARAREAKMKALRKYMFDLRAQSEGGARRLRRVETDPETGGVTVRPGEPARDRSPQRNDYQRPTLRDGVNPEYWQMSPTQRSIEAQRVYDEELTAEERIAVDMQYAYIAEGGSATVDSVAITSTESANVWNEIVVTGEMPRNISQKDPDVVPLTMDKPWEPQKEKGTALSPAPVAPMTGVERPQNIPGSGERERGRPVGMDMGELENLERLASMTPKQRAERLPPEWRMRVERFLKDRAESDRDRVDGSPQYAYKELTVRQIDKLTDEEWGRLDDRAKARYIEKIIEHMRESDR